MKIKLSTLIFYTVIIVFSILMIISLNNAGKEDCSCNGPQNEENLPFKYCMAWGDKFNRETLTWNCYNWTSNKLDCSWVIRDNDYTLTFYDKANPDIELGSYNCSMYVYTYMNKDVIEQIKLKSEQMVQEFMREATELE